MVFCFENCTDPTVWKNCSGDWEKLLKSKAEGEEFAKKSLRSFKQSKTSFLNFVLENPIRFKTLVHLEYQLEQMIRMWNPTGRNEKNLAEL